MSTIAELLAEIEKGELVLPEFQRGFVWTKEKVKNYIDSIYRNYPTGHFLIWKTYKPQQFRGSAAETNAYYRLILDGQQRLTALYTIFKGMPPPFFEGSKLYFPLYFNVLNQEFEYWQPVKMRGKSEWIEVTRFLKMGVGNFFSQNTLSDEDKAFYFQQLTYLNRLDQMRNYSYEIEVIPKTGEEIKTDEVVKIFNLVNSSGMTLSKADLALAHLCASWPEARQNLRSTHETFTESGFNLTTLKGRELEFWVRCLAATATGSILLDGAFYRADIDMIKNAWPDVVKSAEYLTNLIRTEAYTFTSKQLSTPYVLLPIIKYLSTRGHSFSSEAEKRRFLHWFFAAQMWARYSGSLETDLQRDIKALGVENPPDSLIANIISKVGRIKVEAKDLANKGKTSPFFNLVYAASCKMGAVDWFNGMKLYPGHMGSKFSIEIHHIFPLSRLYKDGGLNSKDRAHIAKANEIANLAFLTKNANLKSSDELPGVYLPRVLDNYPSALRAQFVPENPKLWEIENYDAFLEERRRLLATAINEFMEDFLKGSAPISSHNVTDIIAQGESSKVEFKSSLRWDYRLSQVNKALEVAILKTIVGYLNTDGGILLIGITDSREILGIENDYKTLRKGDRDGYELHLNKLISDYIDKEHCLNVSISFHEMDGKDICMLQVESSAKPAYLKEEQGTRFYIRTGNQTQPLDTKEAHDYIVQHWPS